MPLTALEDEIVTSSDFRSELAAHLRRAREGHVLTVILTGGEEPVAVLSRRVLAEQVRALRDMEEDLETALDTIDLLANGQIDTLNAAATEVERSGGVTLNQARNLLGWPSKAGS